MRFFCVEFVSSSSTTPYKPKVSVAFGIVKTRKRRPNRKHLLGRIVGHKNCFRVQPRFLFSQLKAVVMCYRLAKKIKNLWTWYLERSSQNLKVNILYMDFAPDLAAKRALSFQVQVFLLLRHITTIVLIQ